MASKSKDTPEAEYKRFLETAKAVEAEDTPEAFDRAFKRIVKPAPEKPRGNERGS